MSTALKCVDTECCEELCPGLWFCVIWINICKESAAQLSGCRVSCAGRVLTVTVLCM